MCGRYSLNGKARSSLAKYLSFIDRVEPAALWSDRYNISPQQQIPVLRAGADGLEAVALRWGFLPCFVDPAEKTKLRINARAETVTSNGFFRAAFKRRRALVPATGYYEWKATAAGKEPHNFHRGDHEPFLIAGIWESCGDIAGVALITTTANKTAAPVHDRMPVIISSDAAQEWLSGSQPEFFLAPAPDDYLVSDTVSSNVGNVRNQGVELIQPLLEN